MIIVGFHATSKKNAKSILKNGFKLSSNSNDWLGKGIYFYPNIQDAIEWKNSDCYICSFIKLKPYQILNLNKDKGKKIYNKAYETICNRIDRINKKLSPQEYQCSIVNLIWKSNKKIKLIICSFPKNKRKLQTMFDTRERRTEFCIRNDDIIIKNIIINKEELANG